jgi:hypothetical protein
LEISVGQKRVIHLQRRPHQEVPQNDVLQTKNCLIKYHLHKKFKIYLHQFKITLDVAPSGSGWGSLVNVGTVWKVVLIEEFVAEGTLAVPTLEIFAAHVPARKNEKLHQVCARA